MGGRCAVEDAVLSKTLDDRPEEESKAPLRTKVPELITAVELRHLCPERRSIMNTPGG
jgi:hypothetical protein